MWLLQQAVFIVGGQKYINMKRLFIDKDTKEPDKLEVILAKHRHGPIGTVRLDFQKQIGRFENSVSPMRKNI